MINYSIRLIKQDYKFNGIIFKDNEIILENLPTPAKIVTIESGTYCWIQIDYSAEKTIYMAFDKFARFIDYNSIIVELFWSRFGP